MLQARLFAYCDTHSYLLGINHTRLPVNSPRGVEGGAQNYGRDGAMRFDENGGGKKNYEPNSFDGPAQTGDAYDAGYEVSGPIGQRALVKHREDDDYVQAGALYRVMPEDARQRLIDNIAGSLSRSEPAGRHRSVDRELSQGRQSTARACAGRREAERIGVGLRSADRPEERDLRIGGRNETFG
jgi:catalase